LIIKLSFMEMALASYVGTQRKTWAVFKGLDGKHGALEGEGTWETDVIASQCELAVAKATKLYWHASVGRVDEPDVGGYIEVRSIRERSHRLVLNKPDSDDAPYVLVFAQPPYFEIMGWCYGREAKLEANWKPKNNGTRCYFVEQSVLRKSGSLPEVAVEAMQRLVSKE
jgi:hypothetical protein